MDEAVHFILREGERVAANWFFSDSAIDRVIRRVLYHVKDDGALAEADMFIANRCRAVAPSGIAAERATDQARVGAGVNALDGHVAAAHGNVEVDKKIGGIRVADFLQSLFGHVSLDRGLHFGAQGIVVGITFASHGLAAPYLVAGNDWSRTAARGLFLCGAPCPSSVASDVSIRVLRYVDVFIATREKRGARQSASGEERGPGL